MFSFKSIVHRAAATAGIVCAAAFAAPAFAAYPERPITLVVPFAAGGTTDLAARLAADLLQRTSGATVLIENKSGAGGMLGIQYVARANPDGYTILYGSDSLIIQPLVNKAVTVGLDDFTPLVRVRTTGNYLAVGGAVPANISDRGGFDPIVQAESGFMSMNGYADREGVRASSSVMDIAAALMTCNAVLLALRARDLNGEGQYVETTLFDTALTMTGFPAMQYLFGGVEPQRTGNDAPATAPSGLFRCQDRSFMLNSGNSRIFERLLRDVVGRPDLADDPDMLDRNTRLKQRKRIDDMLSEIFMTQPWSYWKPRLRAASVPHGEVRTLGEALTSPEARERKLVTRVAHPKVGWVPNMPLPFKLSATPAVNPVPAPAIGEHTLEVLRQTLCYDEARLDALKRSGSLGAAHKPAPANAPEATP